MRHTLFLSVLLYCYLICSNCTPTFAETNTPIKVPIDSIVIIKNIRQLQVYNHGKLLKAYSVCLGPNPVGAKHFQNDGKTPEGIYHINGKNPNSHYHKALAVSYPSAADIQYARRYGKPAGGDIKIHGLPNGFVSDGQDDVKTDWTLGCIALTDDEIDELYAHVSVGTCVNILP